jgi:hypothetical protein
MSTDEFKSRERHLEKKLKDHASTVSYWGTAVKVVEDTLSSYITEQIASTNEAEYEGGSHRNVR